MQCLHGVENKILLVSYNIKLMKVIMMLSVPSFQNAINLGQNSIITDNNFSRGIYREPPNSLRNICKFYIRKHKSRITMSHLTHALRKNPFKTLASKQNITFALTTTTHRQ